MLARISVILLLLLSLSGPAFASNWVYLQRQEGTRYGSCTEYLDTDSVVKYDDRLTYWTIWVFDSKSEHHDYMKMLFKKEAPFAIPGRHRTLERYYYNGEDKEIIRCLQPMGFSEAPPGEIDRALEYGKPAAGNDAARPDHSTAIRPRWYGTVMLKDSGLYWDVNSIAVWPRDNPDTAEIVVKWVWNKEALERRKAFLSAVKPRPMGYDGLNYTLIHYRFSLTEAKQEVIMAADFTANNERISFFTGDGWQPLEPGSVHDKAKKIVLNWLINGD